MRFPLLAPLGAALLCAFGCASTQKTIMSDPPGAMVTVNDDKAGVTPVKYDFDFSKHVRYDVVLQKDGFIPAEQVVFSDTVAARDTVLQFAMARDPSWDDTVESEIANTFLRIQINPQFAKDTVWQRIFDSVTTRYPSVAQMDKDAGYIKTAPIFKTYHANGQEFTIRTSFVATIASPDPLVYKFEIVSERSSGNDVWTPWHRIFSDDQKLVNEMQDRLSVK
jgi:hypothetical protein